MERDFILTKDDDSYISLIKKNDIFLNMMLPNNNNIFLLKDLDDKVFKYAEKHYKKLGLLIYPVYKHLWRNSNFYIKFDEDIKKDIIICLEEGNSNLRFFNINSLDIEEDFLNDIEIKKNKIYIQDKYIFSLEAFSFFFLERHQKIDLINPNFFFILGLLEACIKIGCCSIPFKQNETKIINKYKLNPIKIDLKSLIISNQIRIFDIWKNKKDVLITGGTGTGKTSQIPKLFWWINMWLDGMEIDYSLFDLTKIKRSQIEKKTTVLSLPRKVLITSNSKFAAKSLGFDNITGSPINCKFKDVKKTDFYNPLAFDFISPFIFSINRNTSFTNVNTIIFDEIHEHDTYCDIGIAIVKKIKQEQDIRNLVLITATITNDLENLKLFLPNLVEMKIKDEYLFPIEEKNLSSFCNKTNNYKDLDLIIKKYSLTKGKSTIIFLPSLQLINKIEEKLKSSLSSFYVIIKLHREAVLENSNLISNISLYKNNHVIILSTPIAESSITIDSAKIVIDTGLFFSKKFFSGEIIYITESMMQQRKGRVGRVSSGIYIKLFNDDKINKSFKKIDTEFLLPYVISLSVYNMKYEDLLIKPEKKRYDKTIKYYNNRGIEFDKNPLYINKIYNSYPCSLNEYIIIYIYGSQEEKKLLGKLDNMEYDNSLDYIKKYNREFLKIAKKINLSIDIVYKNKYIKKALLKKYFEKLDEFYIKTLFDGNKSLLIKEGISLNF